VGRVCPAVPDVGNGGLDLRVYRDHFLSCYCKNK
jgi:hypothetical protein